MDVDITALNELLDEAINQVLQETTDRFRVQDNINKEPNYAAYKDTDRFDSTQTPKQRRSPEKPEKYQTFEESDNTFEGPANYQTNPTFGKYNKYYPYKSPEKYQTAQQSVSDQQVGNTSSYQTYRHPDSNQDQYQTVQQSVSDQQVGNTSSYQTYRHPDSYQDQYQTAQQSVSHQQVGNQSSYQTYKHPDSYQDSVDGQHSDISQNYDEGVIHKVVKDLGDHTLKVEEPPIVGRNVWGALPPMKVIERLKPPADTVVFSLDTGTRPCTNQKDCLRTVREIQARHMGEGLADIQYNFLVGGDGNLYEGRGWGLESGIKKADGEETNYNIAFIGNYQDNPNSIPEIMLQPVQDLVIYGNATRQMKEGKAKREAIRTNSNT